VTATLNQSLRDLAAQFRTALVAAQEERSQRDEFVTINGETECGWVFHERDVMYRETNWVRADAGLPEVPVEAIKAVERQACGHCDYTLKYAFYCAELALDCSPIWKPATTKEA
jgi:hypothetical protein